MAVHEKTHAGAPRNPKKNYIQEDEVTIYEREVRRLKIFCKTEACMNPGGGQKSTHRNVKDFSVKTKLSAIEAFKNGTRVNATNAVVTQGKWKKTGNGWLCPKCVKKNKRS